ncbi:ThuA domain-containing protein [Actinomadura alba]|uniref:ThuA domain-containing protein n=1 Tax=Actinomadura alba TaxID=406431 RepID=A0ABR7LXH8_9ACTN|nr:ThuA domain-containing protein [Actinomadura alba]MBC6469577.1 ThuA domain-containing protein [Actinomadura alba]
MSGIFRRIAALAATALAAAGLVTAADHQATANAAAPAFEVLVFSKTAGFRHDSIPAGQQAIRDLGAANNFGVTTTEDANAFTTANLARYKAVVFLSTTGDVLNGTQQSAFESYVNGGGGYVGVHAAADTEYDWPYYGQLVGAWFRSHPAIQQATIRVEDRSHPATAHLGATWQRTDEWYNYRTNPRGTSRVLMSLDESSYSGGDMGGDHPITWCRAQAAGRSFYTGLGHTQQSYADGAFRNVLLGGIRYAAGAASADCRPNGGGGSGTVEGESFSSQSGVQVAPHAGASGGQTLGYIDNGDWAGYASVSTAGARGFTAKISSAGAGGTITIRSGSQTGTVLGTVTVPITGGWETFQTISTTLTGTGTGPLFLTFTGGSGALFDIDTFALTSGTTPDPPAEVSPNVHVFYYPWYGSPAGGAGWRHWQQGGHTPPQGIGANFYPTLGAYDSGDFTGAVDRHMRWIRDAGAGVLVYSWWGRGGYEDGLARGVLDAAARHGVKVAWHIEPYGGRTADSVVADINYINATYGSHPAYYRAAQYGNRPAFYVFESLRTTDWTALDQVNGSNIILAQTTDGSKIAHFSGMYTYDAIAGATAPGWKSASDYARANNLIWAPSVGPGYIDDRAVPGNTTPTLDRAGGATYDREWSNALDPATGGPPSWVSITSFNEWHEGSTIEPASSAPPGGFGYQTYEGAYGKTGAAAETAYLERTKYWATEFEARRARAAANRAPAR